MSDRDLRELERIWLDTQDLAVGIRYYRKVQAIRGDRCPLCSHPEALPLRASAILRCRACACANCGNHYTPNAAEQMADYLEEQLTAKSESLASVLSQGQGGTAIQFQPGQDTASCTVTGCLLAINWGPYAAILPDGWMVHNNHPFCTDHSEPRQFAQFAQFAHVFVMTRGPYRDSLGCVECDLVYIMPPPLWTTLRELFPPPTRRCEYPDCDAITDDRYDSYWHSIGEGRRFCLDHHGHVSMCADHGHLPLDLRGFCDRCQRFVEGRLESEPTFDCFAPGCIEVTHQIEHGWHRALDRDSNRHYCPYHATAALICEDGPHASSLTGTCAHCFIPLDPLLDSAP